ncbi:MAG: AraC family transcriptional regulator [Bacillales bacterium]|nr:AraC family transcriptional regulator [Bacillales bacterium]
MKEEYSLPNNDIYVKYIENNINLDIKVLVVGYEKCNKTKKEISKENTSLTILHFVLRGEGVLIVDDISYPIKAGAIFILPSSGKHTYYPNPNNPWEYIWVEMFGYSASLLADKVSLNRSNHVIYPKNFNIYIKELLKLINHKYHEDNNQLAVLAGIMKIFSILYGEIGINVNPNENSNPMVTKIVEYVNNNFTKPELTVNQISNTFFISEEYLSRLFKKETKITLSKYIIETRLQKALSLLNTSNFSISQIATIVGYKNPLYFSTEFKKRFKCSPLMFRKKERELNENKD